MADKINQIYKITTQVQDNDDDWIKFLSPNQSIK